MATNTKKTEPKEEVVEEEFEDTSEKTVTIRLPRDRNDNSPVFVSVNERTWLIKRGEDVEVPLCVAEVLREREKALDKMYAYREKVEQK